MSFIHEEIDDNIRQNIGANVASWVADHAREVYLFSKPVHWQIRAEGDTYQYFTLQVGSSKFAVKLLPARDFFEYHGKHQHEFKWEQLLECRDIASGKAATPQVIELLKEALSLYGGGWHSIRENSDFSVSFSF